MLVFVGSSLGHGIWLLRMGRPLSRWVGLWLGLAARGGPSRGGVEALRGMGSRGDGRPLPARDVLAVVAITSGLLLMGAYFFVRSQGRILARPAGWGSCRGGCHRDNDGPARAR